LPAHGVQAGALIKLVLECIAAPHHIVGSYACGALATLDDRDSGMITTIDDPHGKINSDLQQLCFVWGGIQLFRRSSEAFDPASLGYFHEACRPIRSDAKPRAR
jgi:hypothetical protein